MPDLFTGADPADYIDTTWDDPNGKPWRAHPNGMWYEYVEPVTGGSNIITSLTAPLDLTATWAHPVTGRTAIYIGGGWVADAAGASGAGFYLESPQIVAPVVSGSMEIDMALSSNFFAEIAEDTSLAVTNRLGGVFVLYATQTTGGSKLLLDETFRTKDGKAIQLSATSGVTDMVTFICDGTAVYVDVANGWRPPYQEETLGYMAFASASPAIQDPLDAWIKGLKDLNAWNTARMWILRENYHASGPVLYGLGGAGRLDATINNGAGSVVRSNDEFIFNGGGANAYLSGVNLIPATPTGSYMFTYRRPQNYTHYGPGFGGNRGTLHFETYTGMQLSDGSSGTSFVVPGNQGAQGTADAPSPDRICNLIAVTGEQSATTLVNGSILPAHAGGKNYTDFPRSANTQIAGNQNFASPAPTAYSFVCAWTDNQSANFTAIYELYKSTIGQGLDLP